MTLPPPGAPQPPEQSPFPHYGEYSPNQAYTPTASWDAPPPLPAPKKKSRLAPVLISLGVVFAVLIAGGVTAWLQRDNIRDLVTVWNYEPTSIISGYIERSELSDRGEFLFKASEPVVAGPTEFNDTCGSLEEGTGVLGCYLPWSKQIFLFDVTDDRLDGVEEVVASHEMLHAAWDRVSASEKSRLEPLLEAEVADLAADDELAERLALYARAEPGERANELHSIIGTEIADISKELEAHYAEYFDDRATVVGLHEKSNAVLVDIEKRTTALVDELDTLYKETSADYEKYKDGYDKLDKDVAAFNAKNNAYGFTSQAQFDAERNALFARQKKLDKLYKSIKKREVVYEEKSEELEELNAQAASLNKQLNIVERESEF